MQRAFWYTGLVSGGLAAFVSLVVVAALLVNGAMFGTGVVASVGDPVEGDMDHGGDTGLLGHPRDRGLGRGGPRQ